MPYFDNDGVRIHYQVDGKGAPIVLMHGTSGSVGDWYENGWVGGLKDDYQIILIDHRGHGYSDKPHDSDSYSLEISVSDVVGVLDELRIEKANYFGYSMGGFIGFWSSQVCVGAIERARHRRGACLRAQHDGNAQALHQEHGGISQAFPGRCV